MNKLVLLPALVAALSLPTPAHAAEPGSGFASYGLVANAPGLAVEGLYRDVAVTVPETTSTLSTGGVGAALATVAWPGPIVGNLGTTMLVVSDQAPPQVTALNDPVRAEARSGGVQHATYTTLPGTSLAASATSDTVTALSQTGSTSLPVGTVAAVSGATRTAFTGAASAVGTATGTVQDLSLAGGAIRIGSVTSRATATDDGVLATGSGSTVVTGMSVGGVPVSVDDRGLHVAGTSAPLATQALADAVRSLGLTAVLTSPRVTRSAGAVTVTAGALVLVYSANGSSYALTLGRAAVGLAASRGGPAVGLPVLPALGSALPPTAGPAGSPVLPRAVAPAVGSAGSIPVLPPTLSAPTPGVVAALQAAAVRLASGASGLGVAGLLLLATGLVVVLRRLPDRLLAATGEQCRGWDA